MHTNTELSADRDINHEANLFAASFLMPAEHVLPELDHGINIATFATYKKKWKVSMISILYRADDLGLITAGQKRYLVDQFNKLGIRRNEPIDLDIPAEQPKLIKQHLETYKQKAGITNRQLAEQLCIKTKELVQMHNL